MSNTSLGERIRIARKELGMTQSDLAQSIVTSSMICQIENGKAFPSFSVLSSLAERLAKPIEFFVSDTDTQKRQRSTYTLAKALMAAGSYEKAYLLLKGIQEGGNEPDDFNIVFSECCQKMGKFEEAAAPLDEMLVRAQHEGNYKQMFTILFRLGEIAEQGGQHQLALYHWQKGLDLVEKANIDQKLATQLLTSIGSSYYRLGYVEDAIRYLQQAYDNREATPSLEQLGHMYLNLALSYRDSNDYEKAADFSERAYAIFKSLTNSKLTTDVRRSLGVLLAKQNQFDEALSILQVCRENYAASSDMLNVGITQLEIAFVLQLSGQTEDAIGHLQSSLPMLVDDELELARAHRLLADLHRKQRNLPKAIHHLNVSLQIYQKHGQSVAMMEAMNLSVALYEEWNVFRESKFDSQTA